MVLRNKALIFGAVLCITLLAYLPSMRGEFQFDDDIFIAESDYIRGPLKLFENGIASFFLSRPLTQLTLSVNYAVGGLNVEGYHLFNLLVHFFVTAMVYLFARNVLFAVNNGNAFGSRGGWMALTAAGIFALHPLQTGTVSYVIQRAESLASLFFMLGLYCLIRFVKSAGSLEWLFWFFGMICFILGWGSKEIIVTMPLVLMLYAFYFMDRADWNRSFMVVSPFIAAGMIFGISLLLSLRGNIAAGFDIKGLGRSEYLYTQASVLLTYLRLIFFPLGQNFDFDYPISRQLLSVKVIGSIFFWSVTVLLSVFSLSATGRWKWHVRMIGFGILWFLTILIPTSSFIPLRDVIFEHRVYLPIFGIIFAFVSAGDMIWQKAAERYGVAAHKIGAAAAVVLMLVLAVLTYERNMVWKSKLSLWQDVVNKSPYKARGHNNLGNCYYLLGKYEQAVEEYTIAAKLDPDFVEPSFNLILSFKQLGRAAEAERAGLLYNERVLRLRKMNMP